MEGLSLSACLCQLLTNIYQLRLLSIRTWVLGLTANFAMIWERNTQALKKYRLNKSDHKQAVKLRSLSQRVKFLVWRKHVLHLAGKNRRIPSYFWSSHKVVLQSKAKTNYMISYNGIKAKTAAGNAKLFNSYISAVFPPLRSVVIFGRSTDLSQHKSVIQMTKIHYLVRNLPLFRFFWHVKSLRSWWHLSSTSKGYNKQIAPSVLSSIIPCALFASRLNGKKE